MREVNGAFFCLSGPYSAPHILIQKRIVAGAQLLVPILRNPQELRLRVLHSNQCVRVSATGLAQSRLIYDQNGWNCQHERGPFLIENQSKDAMTVVLEKIEWDDKAATAAYVTSLQEFRDLFADEVLRPGRQVNIESVTFFFSDLAASTVLYERMGDGPAFHRVGGHFDFLGEFIARHHGAIVKTMGDAIMAVFSSPEDAVQAALEMQREFPAFCERVEEIEEISLKIGLHHGAALAVNSNDRLDYFGRSVNIASRVSSASRGGDIVLTQDVWNYGRVRHLLCESGAAIHRFSANLRGVEQVLELFRVEL